MILYWPCGPIAVTNSALQPEFDTWDLCSEVFPSLSTPPPLSRWQNPRRHRWQPGLHQRQLHPYAGGRGGVLLRLLPGPAAHHRVGLLADDLGEQVRRGGYDDEGGGTGKGQMSQVLAREAGHPSGHRQVPAPPGEPAEPGELPDQDHPHGGERGENVKVPEFLIFFTSCQLCLNQEVKKGPLK